MARQLMVLFSRLFWTGLVLSAAILCSLSCSGRPNDPNAVSFVVFGDWGTGGVNQWIVSLEVGDYCEEHECEFIFTLGDNFYDGGVASVEDEKWQTVYHRMYDHLDLPFYALLGNHDTEGDPSAQVDYSQTDPNWKMPGEYYSVAFPEGRETPDVEFFVINSDNFDNASEIWLRESLDASRASWKILAMHIPLMSNGPHGDDSNGIGAKLLNIVCGKIDLILSGHEHLFSYLRGTVEGCPVEQVILGTGGADLFDPDLTDSRVVSTGKFYGYAWFQASSSMLTFRVMQVDHGEAYFKTSWQK